MTMRGAMESSVYGPIFSMVEAKPDHIAMHLPSGSLTYVAFSQLVRSFAMRLSAQGIARNSVVAIWDIGGLSFTLSALAVSLLGGHFVPASQIAILFAPHLGITHHIRDAEKGGTARFDRTILVDKSWLGEVWPSLPGWREFPGPSSTGSAYIIAQSSGSTGTPKFMELSHRITAARVADRRALPFHNQERQGSLFRADTYIGHIYLLHALSSGATFIFGQDADFHLAKGTQSLVGSPAQFRKFLSSIPDGPPRFRSCGVGGAPMTKAFYDLARRHFEIIVNTIGATEVGPIADLTIEDGTADMRCVGKPYHHIDLQIVDEDGAVLEIGQEGIVRIKTSRGINRYLVDPDNTKDVFRDGYFYPGDSGFLDETGRLYVTGRVRDLFNINGTKINAARVDDILSHVHGIKDAMAFADLDESGFSVLSAIVTIQDGISEDIVIRNLSELPHIIPSKHDVPHHVYFVADLPRNDNGKPLRASARDLIKNATKRQIRNEW